MKVQFRLAWLKPGKSVEQAFKNKAMASLFNEYTRRASQYTSCQANGCAAQDVSKIPGESIWLCDVRLDGGPSKKSDYCSSELLAKKLGEALEDGTVKTLSILIGPPDGWSDEQRKSMKANFVWCFGPLTLPHELAAVVASEQFYRAWTILKKEPYHLGH